MWTDGLFDPVEVLEEFGDLNGDPPSGAHDAMLYRAHGVLPPLQPRTIQLGTRTGIYSSHGFQPRFRPCTRERGNRASRLWYQL